MNAAAGWVEATISALAPLADPERAGPMASYMKGVAPFLGVMTPVRRRALRAAWAPLPTPTADDVAEVSRALWELPEREYQYAACDLIARHVTRLPAGFVADPVQELLTTAPWWDTVDSLGSAAITPLVARHPADVELMWAWLDSGDRWLIRAAIQHQRGLKRGTDLDRLFTMCGKFAGDREFFIAKAIGWALRDVTAWDPAAVQSFVDGHPDLSPVARREATKGLSRSARP
jgi:3-methyladenine DNA glycosylase AlkD